MMTRKIARAAFGATGCLAASLAFPLAWFQDSLSPEFTPGPDKPSGERQQGRLSVRFSNAPAQEVFDWLRSQGVSFAADTTGIGRDTRLTLNLNGVTRDQAVRVVAAAMGLTVTREGDAYALGRRRLLAVPGAALPKGNLAPMAPERDWDELSKRVRDQVSKALEAEPFVHEFDLRLREEIPDRLRLKFSEPKVWFFDDRGLDEGERKKLRELPDRLRRELKDKDWTKLKEIPEQIEKSLREFDLDNPERAIAPKMPKVLEMRSMDVKALFESVTEAQWAKHEDQGHLELEDLTHRQRQMLGKIQGAVVFSINIEGRSLTIKSR